MHIINLEGNYRIDRNNSNKTDIKPINPQPFWYGREVMIIFSEDDIANMEKMCKFIRGLRSMKIFIPRKCRNTMDERIAIDLLQPNFEDGVVNIAYY